MSGSASRATTADCSPPTRRSIASASPTKSAATSATSPLTTTIRRRKQPRRTARVVDVDILGHIFEQSFTDLKRRRDELDGLTERVGADKHRTRRKKEGAFFTPAFITRYIIK